MLGDAASLWKTARAAVGRVQDTVSTALENIGGDDEFGAEELESYKEQLAEAQMQHVELSKTLDLRGEPKNTATTSQLRTAVCVSCTRGCRPRHSLACGRCQRARRPRPREPSCSPSRLVAGRSMSTMR